MIGILFLLSESSHQSIGLLARFMMPKLGYVVPGFIFADNTILVWTEGTNELNQYEYKNGHFPRTKAINVPEDMSQVRYQDIPSSGKRHMTYLHVFQKAMLTFYDKDFKLSDVQSCGGLLIGVVDSLKWLIFDNLFDLDGEESRNEITVKSMRDLSVVHQLSFEHRYTRKDFARGACGHPIDGMIAVVFSNTTWLDIFSNNGMTILHYQ